MPDMLRQQPFSPDILGEVAGFCCGDEPWEHAQSVWIREKALAKMATHGTEVWLYFNELDDLVAFGSLGTTRRRFPPPDGEYTNLSIIPSLAIQTKFQRKPDDPPRYSNQIMEDLIAKSQLHGTDLLTLDVHHKNARAIRFYERFGFVHLGDVYRNHVKMFLRLSG